MTDSRAQYRIGVDIGGTFVDKILTVLGADWPAIARARRSRTPIAEFKTRHG